MTASTAPRSGLPPWLPAIVVAIVPFAIWRLKYGAVEDPDSFWHLLGGRHTLATHSVTGPDPIGIFASHTWVQHEWLTEVGMALVDRAWGLAGLARVFLGLYVVVFFVIYACCRQRSGVLVAGTVSAVAWLGTTASLTVRPQVVSFVLLGVTLFVWSRSVREGEGRPRTPWLVIPLTWVWAMAHGFWFMGPAVGAAFVVGGLAEGRLDLRRDRWLVAAPVLAGLSGALTPIGPRLLLAPFTVNAYAKFATEWTPPNVREPFVAATFLLLVVVAVGWSLRAQRAPWTDVLLWVVALGWALLYSRTVALAAILVAPLAAAELQRWLRRGGDRLSRAEVGLLATGALLALALTATTPRAAAPPIIPWSMSAALGRLPAGTVVMNDDSTGGWLELTQPRLRVVLDTRTEIYTYEHIVGYINARAARPGWETYIRGTRASAALLIGGTPLIESLESIGWRVTESRDGFSLLVAG